LAVVLALAVRRISLKRTVARRSTDKDLMTHLVTDFIAQQLQDVSLEQVLSQLPEHSRFQSLGSPMVKQETKPRFKPLKIHKLPSGPNSVFNLAQSMAM